MKVFAIRTLINLSVDEGNRDLIVNTSGALANLVSLIGPGTTNNELKVLAIKTLFYLIPDDTTKTFTLNRFC